MLLVCSLFTLALATPPTVTTDGSCTAADDHPENGGYHVVGVKGYKEITADGDKDDSTPYGEFGQLADDTLWSSEASYPNGGQSLCAKGKDLRQGRYGPYEYECRNDMEHHNWRTVHTCSIMRFSFPSSSDSTVYKMTSNESMWACDFSDAVQITDGGELASGASFVDYVFEDDSLDKKYFFASLKGCEQGQRIAVAVAAPYGTTYDAAFKEGTMTKRIQHCDCDFGLDTGMEDNEVAHTGFVDGCMSEMPSNLDCCPGEDVELVKGGHSNSYKNGGNVCGNQTSRRWWRLRESSTRSAPTKPTRTSVRRTRPVSALTGGCTEEGGMCIIQWMTARKDAHALQKIKRQILLSRIAGSRSNMDQLRAIFITAIALSVGRTEQRISPTTAGETECRTSTRIMAATEPTRRTMSSVICGMSTRIARTWRLEHSAKVSLRRR